MKITMGGVRGSCPVAQPDFMKYGGETSSYLIEGRGGEVILVDAGTGIRKLGQLLAKNPDVSSGWLFMTHYHLDHVVGLSTFPMFYQSDWKMIVAAPGEGSIRVRDAVERILDRPFWPVQVEHLRSGNTFLDLEGAESLRPLPCEGIEVRWCKVHHDGGCTAYRFDEPATGASVVIATDMEWGASSPAERAALEKLIRHPRPAGLLVMDGQFTEENIERFRGWGHSTWQEAADLASRAGVGRLLITHHDPSSKDDDLDRIQKQVQERLSSASFAREGMTVVLPSSREAGQ